MKKRYGAVLALGIYVMILCVLTAAEKTAEGSGICSFADALWYSLVTVTTVGYGDLYPVTMVGKGIGVFFLLLSVGFLALLIGAVLSLLTGRILPGLCLSVNRKKRWLIFSCKNEQSEALAKALMREYPDSLLIFCRTAENKPTDGCVCWPQGPDDVLRQRGAQDAPRWVFLMADDELQNCEEAYALSDSTAKLYCCAQERRDLPQVSFFNPYDCCARQFWQEHPLGLREKCVLLVGDGRYAQALLSRAVVVNCMAPVHTAQYHLFGDWAAYRLNHYALAQALAIDCETEGKDAIFYHAQPWNADAALLERADRIIFCYDDENENIRCAQTLARCFTHEGKAFVRTSRQAAEGRRFGEAHRLYTTELVMKSGLDHLARQMHERYRSGAKKPTPEWAQLTPFLRESNRAAADHIPTKIRLLLQEDGKPDRQACVRAAQRYRQGDAQLCELCRKNEHERWLRFYGLYNWRYDPVRDDAKRRHPCITAYEQLSEQEQAKDDYAWMQLEQLAEDAKIQEQV